MYSNERLPTRLAIQSVVCHQDSISKSLVITLYIINSDMGALSWLNVKEQTCKVLHPWALFCETTVCISVTLKLAWVVGMCTQACKRNQSCLYTIIKNTQDNLAGTGKAKCLALHAIALHWFAGLMHPWPT